MADKKKGNSPKANNLKPETDEYRLGDPLMRTFTPAHVDLAVKNRRGGDPNVVACTPTIEQYMRWAKAEAQTSSDVEDDRSD